MIVQSHLGAKEEKTGITINFPEYPPSILRSADLKLTQQIKKHLLRDGYKITLVLKNYAL